MTIPFLTSHFYIEGKDYGRGLIRTVPSTSNERQWNTAFVCEKCGRLWASCPIAELGSTGHWIFVHAVCERHSGISWCVPGSLWKPGHADLIESFSPAVLKRELLLHIAYTEKFL